MTREPQAPIAAPILPAAVLDLIGELGRAVDNLVDDCETSGAVGAEIHTITDQALDDVSDVLDRIDALPFAEPGLILGPGAMLQVAVKRTFAPRTAADPELSAALGRITAYLAARDASLSPRARENGHRLSDAITMHGKGDDLAPLLESDLRILVAIAQVAET